MVEIFWLHPCITDVASNDFDRPNLLRFFVDSDVVLAPNPTFDTPKLWGMPFAFTFYFGSSTVDEAFYGLVPPRYRRLTFSVPWR